MRGRGLQFAGLEPEFTQLVQQQGVVRLYGEFALHAFDRGRVISGQAQFLDLVQARVGSVSELRKAKQ